jgi:thiamine-monophosphate kinase
VDPLGFVLTGGDDHPLVGTFPSPDSVPEGWQVIGSVQPVDPEGEPAVTVDGTAYDGEQGYRHF